MTIQVPRTVGRRRFLQAASVAGGVLFAGAMGGLTAVSSIGRALAAPGNGGYGPLSPKPDLRDGVLRLPDGFQYRSFSASLSGMTMSDGRPVPLAHDGMAAFNMPDGTIRLVRNHADRNRPGLGSIPGAGGYDG